MKAFFFRRVLRLCSKAKPDAKDSRSDSERVSHGVVKGVEESKLENLLALFLTCKKGVSPSPKVFVTFWVVSVCVFQCAVTKRPWIW